MVVVVVKCLVKSGLNRVVLALIPATSKFLREPGILNSDVESWSKMVKASNLSKFKSEMKKETSLSLSSDASDIFRAVVKGIVKAWLQFQKNVSHSFIFL